MVPGNFHLAPGRADTDSAATTPPAAPAEKMAGTKSLPAPHTHEHRMRGDLDFERLVDSHHAALYRFALSLCRNETEAGDLVQETFYLWAAKGHQLADPSKVKSWLFTTLHREFLGKRR